MIQIQSRPRCSSLMLVRSCLAQAAAAAPVVEAVAERDDATRIVVADQPPQPFEGVVGIIGRQHRAADGEARALFQVKVGDGQQPFVRPIERARELGDEAGAGEVDRLAVPDMGGSAAESGV